MPGFFCDQVAMFNFTLILPKDRNIFLILR